jgi:hypothetical protein
MAYQLCGRGLFRPPLLPRSIAYFFQVKGKKKFPFINPSSNNFAEETILVDMKCLDWADAEKKSKRALESISLMGYSKTTCEIWYCDELGKKVFASVTDFERKEQTLYLE